MVAESSIIKGYQAAAAAAARTMASLCPANI